MRMLLAAAFVGACALSPAFGLCSALTVAFFLFARSRTPKEYRLPLTVILAGSLAVRLFLLALLQLFLLSQQRLDLFGDAADNITHGILIARALPDLNSPLVYHISHLWSNIAYNIHIKTFFNGFFFLLAGPDLLSLKYTNALAIAAAAFLLFRVGCALRGPRTGLFAAALLCFWPTLLIWSLSDLKEAQTILTICLLLFCGVRIILNPGDARILGALVLAGGYLVLLRTKLLPIVIAYTTAVTVTAFFKTIPSGKRPFAVLILALLSGALLLWQQKYFWIGYDLVLGAQIGFLTSGGWNYDFLRYLNVLPPHSPGFMLLFSLFAWFHFLSEPLPWHGFSLGLRTLIPFTLLWYALLAMAVRGLFMVWQHPNKRSRIVPLCLWFLIYGTMVGMSIANIGTAVRFRDALLPAVVLLAGCGLRSHDDSTACP